ncbi:MAG: tryptophan--tRNA ligase [Desulfovibrio sp.]|nr:tryptophan--tRNA ligase [Desulfovibrio sp.]MCA1985606.1 tryptophan--tRNA ligase [Desulfovibrio sp.]
MTPTPRIVSGMRPTGPLHLGHYFGVLKQWIALQASHQCYFFVADWHALTSEYHDPLRIRGFVPELVMDWVAAGLDPARCIIFQQSMVAEHVELHLVLSMITPTSWLERNPTYKDQLQQLAEKDLTTYGFLGYPVLQAADILLYKPQAVPVGQDQLPHLELTREIARRFNFLYGETFPEPQALLTPAAKCPGLDGRKMSKSYGNSIYLREDFVGVRSKVMQMLTDANRKRKTDPGDPDICNLFPYHVLMTSPEDQATIREACVKAEIGCVDCKKKLIESMEAFLIPLHDRRRKLVERPDEAWDILEQGSVRAREEARRTQDEVRRRINFLGR